MFDIDSTLDEDIKNGLPYNFNEYEKCTGFSKRHGNDLIRGEYILAESIDKSSKRYYSGKTNLRLLNSINNNVNSYLFFRYVFS